MHKIIKKIEDTSLILMVCLIVLAFFGLATFTYSLFYYLTNYLENFWQYTWSVLSFFAGYLRLLLLPLVLVYLALVFSLIRKYHTPFTSGISKHLKIIASILLIGVSLPSLISDFYQSFGAFQNSLHQIG